MAQLSLYDVLGVQPTASHEQIVAAYRQAARRTHPDAGGSAGAFQQVTAAYQVLADPDRRRDYDHRLLTRRAGEFHGPPVPPQTTGPRRTAGPERGRQPRRAGEPSGSPASPHPSGSTTAGRGKHPTATTTTGGDHGATGRVRRRYLAMMAVCLVLFVLAGGVVRLVSVPAALAMMIVAATIPPVAAIIANRSRP